MKKTVLASSIAAAVFGMSAAGAVQAQSEYATFQFVPYYTAQDANATLLSLVNTDTVNGKAVKVRFRGAANSDDVFDFQVFLSPGDVWTANVSKGADGKAKLATSDASCTKPSKSVINATSFVTSRLDPSLTGDALANGTREGYVEIFTMGDVPPKQGGTGTTANALFTAIKHVKGVAPCTGSAWTALDELTPGVQPADTVMLPPSGGLTTSWTIINTTSAAAWSGLAEAVPFYGGSVKAYFPQTAADVSAEVRDANTADPLLISPANVQKVSSTTGALVTSGDAQPVIKIASYDLPDMSTPLISGYTPSQQAYEIAMWLTKSEVVNEFLTDPTVRGATDWAFTMPTRRYSVAMAYSKIGASDDGRRFNAELTQQFNAQTTSVSGRQICVKGVSVKAWDREENTTESTTEVVISPSTPQAVELFCGEASVLSFNNGAATTSGSLKANVAVKDLDVDFQDGWAKITLPEAGLPIVGSSFLRAWSSSSQSFGASFKHRSPTANIEYPSWYN